LIDLIDDYFDEIFIIILTLPLGLNLPLQVRAISSQWALLCNPLRNSEYHLTVVIRY